MKSEQRADKRQHLSYPCWIVTNSQAARLARITNISQSGAHLTAEMADRVPDEFILNLTEDGAVRRICRVAWRTGDELGIIFQKMPNSVSDTVKV